MAQELLRTNVAGFLSDAEAVRASFADIGQHVTAIAEGANATVKLVIESLAPESIDQEAKAQASILKSRPTLCWEILNRRHAALTEGEGDNSALKRTFAEGYSRASSDAAP